MDEGQPVQFIMNGNNVSSMTGLSKINESVESISSAYVLAGNKTYRVSDKCVVYNSQYNVINIEDALSDSSLKCYAYIDKYSNTVRIIKAVNK